jgi:hypothetical protein
MSVSLRLPGMMISACLAATPALGDACDYKPSKLANGLLGGAATTLGGGAAATGAGMKLAGYYTLVHSTSGLTMLGSTLAGGSGAGTIGIMANTGGAIGTAAAALMSTATIAFGTLTVIALGGFEGVCYFQVERVDDPFQVRDIIESIAANDEAVSVLETDDGPAMAIETEDGQQTYLIRDLYIADGELKHRDWLWNTSLGPVAYVQPDEDEKP